MSDIGIPFPFWFAAGFALVALLPVMTAILAGLGIAAYRIRRRDRARPLPTLKWVAIGIAPFWLAGVVLGAVVLVATIRTQLDAAQRYFTLPQAGEVDGVPLPGGTRVSLDESRALQVAELPDGATASLRGASWQGKIEFAMPAHAPGARHGQITEGTLAAPAEIDGIPCRAGATVSFYWDGRLMACSLARDAEIAVTLTRPDDATETRKLRCLAGDTITLAGLRPGELDGCRLAAVADFGEIACAAGERILVQNGRVSACTFARAANFGPLALPAGAAVTYYDGRPSNFRLPAQGPPVAGFGLLLPPGSEGAFCDRQDALQRLTVARTAYVTIGDVKLTGFLEFDCAAGGMFESGLLFEDTPIAGSWRERGALIRRDDLASKPPG